MLDNVNNRLAGLWNKYYRNAPDYLRYAPEFIFREPTKQSITFIGLNPSLNTKWWNEKLKEKGIGERIEDVLGWSAEFDIARLRDIYEKIEPSETYSTYFAPLKHFAEECGLKDFQYLDLLYVRETHQAKTRKFFECNESVEKISFLNPNREPHKQKKHCSWCEEFVKEQMEITKDLLSKIQPRAVCVFNALAARLAKIMWGIGDLNGSPSHWEMTINNVIVPVFLGPMLTNGQMDIFTRSRLEYDIRELLKKNKT